jgi:hypothetical protein
MNVGRWALARATKQATRAAPVTSIRATYSRLGKLACGCTIGLIMDGQSCRIKQGWLAAILLLWADLKIGGLPSSSMPLTPCANLCE